MRRRRDHDELSGAAADGGGRLMGRFGDDKIEEVRSRADIVEIVGAHVRLRRAGRNFVGLCPFHNEKTPSFSVNAERGFFHCFGCGVGGSAFNFIMRVEGLTFPEAVRSLAKKYGVTIPEHDVSGPAAGEREAMLKASEVAAEFFAHVHAWIRAEPAEFAGEGAGKARTARRGRQGRAGKKRRQRRLRYVSRAR